MMQKTLFPILVAYASITNQGPEKIYFPELELLLRGQAY